MFDPQVEMGHTVSGPENRLGLLSVSSKDCLQTQEGRLKLIQTICYEVIELTGSTGVHPGDIAVTCDDFDSQTLFGVNEISDLVEEFNEQISRIFECKKRVPQATSYPSESITRVHKKSTDCDCKFFLGPYKRLKGLTVKVVIFVNGHGRSSGYNRLAVYTALSRSSCTFRLLNVQVLDMSTEQYQIDRMNFDKGKMNDDG